MEYKWITALLSAILLSSCASKSLGLADKQVKLRFSDVVITAGGIYRSYTEIDQSTFQEKTCSVRGARNAVNLSTADVVRTASVKLILLSKEQCNFQEIILNEWKLIEITDGVQLDELKTASQSILDVFRLSKKQLVGKNIVTVDSIDEEEFIDFSPTNHIANLRKLNSKEIEFIAVIYGRRYYAKYNLESDGKWSRKLHLITN